jgi:KDO2-lipid IV(A) lauroyltransferase
MKKEDMPLALNLFNCLSSRRVKAAMKHLDLAFADKITTQRKKEIISNSLMHFMSLLLSAFLKSKLTKCEILESVQISDESLGNLNQAIYEDREKGVFLLTCHLGHFEHAIKYFGHKLPGKVSVLSKKFRPQWLNDMIQEKRRKGVDVIYKDGAVKKIMSSIKNGKSVGVMMDQNRPDGIFVPYFNRLAGTSPMVAALSAKLDVYILPVCCVLNAEGQYELIINQAFKAGGEGEKKEIIEEGTKRCNEEMEKFILRYPDQYLWTHMRYKACAPDQEPLYDTE